jgi:hypothetical protein
MSVKHNWLGLVGLDHLDLRGKQQEQACAYKVTLGRIQANIIIVEKQCVAYSGCVYVALATQHAMRMRYIFVYGLPGSTIFFHIIS